CFSIFFFFQAEDGIRGRNVTGVQTCALPIWGMYFTAFLFFMDHVVRSTGTQATIADVGSMLVVLALLPLYAKIIKRIGSRASVFLGMIPYIGGARRAVLGLDVVARAAVLHGAHERAAHHGDGGDRPRSGARR